MLPNRNLSLELPCAANIALKICYDNDSLLWHMRYGNLYMRGLKLLHNKKTITRFCLIDWVH